MLFMCVFCSVTYHCLSGLGKVERPEQRICLPFLGYKRLSKFINVFLISRSFDKPLNAEYFSSLKNRLHTLYVTER